MLLCVLVMASISMPILRYIFLCLEANQVLQKADVSHSLIQQTFMTLDDLVQSTACSVMINSEPEAEKRLVNGVKTQGETIFYDL